ncbi:MAG: TIGR04423 family type III CRISPR-associated protein [Arcobacteraceae bacterium]
MKKTEAETVDFINNLQGYEGYVQFSHRPIDKNRDIFYEGKKVEVADESGFIYEAHFCNENESISIKQVNDCWLISKTDILNIEKNDTQEYLSDIEDFNYKIKMAQIWEEKEDLLCENMRVKKVSKVIFVGFVKQGEAK